MFEEFIEEHSNGVKTALVLDNSITLVQNESSFKRKLRVVKIPFRNDVSLFLTSTLKTNKQSHKEETCIATKEDAIRLIYTLKSFLDITNEDVSNFEKTLIN